MGVQFRVHLESVMSATVFQSREQSDEILECQLKTLTLQTQKMSGVLGNSTGERKEKSGVPYLPVPRAVMCHPGEIGSLSSLPLQRRRRLQRCRQRSLT